jgi:glycosyltransferase involved in cell wall biosynthesis
MKVCAIIPALNEETAIGRVVSEVPRNLVDEIIVVDNDSADATAKVAREAGARVVAGRERGYGASCMAGVAAAPDADVYVFLDGDGSDVVTRLPELLALVLEGEVALALGVRAGDVEPGSMLWHQRLGNGFFLRLLALLSGRRLHDLPSFKVISAHTLRSLDLRERTHGWTAELISKAALLKLPMVEVETGYRRRVGESKVSGTVKGSALAATRIFWAIVRSWADERKLGATAVGGTIGSLVAMAMLVFAAVGLLSVEGTNYKVLVAVWLCALPVIGVGVLAGYAAGWAFTAIRHIGRARG